MNRPIRTTVVYGLISGCAVVPAALLLSQYSAWPTAFKLTLWADITFYGVLLARWSGTRLLPLIFPLVVLLGAALWPGLYGGFFVLALGVFTWMRSGICFQETPIRTMMAEVVTMFAGTTLLLFFRGHTPTVMALNVCLFFLVQSLYFFWVPVRRSEQGSGVYTDTFEQAAAHANKIMDGM